ncbi:MAG TPA: hypothetical protein GX740_01295 [Acholeplasmataceae bacterium]|nr:hypothetical protein [Acholeplasmataceae bacterium]
MNKFKAIVNQYENFQTVIRSYNQSEKIIHKTIKDYLQANKEYQEIKLGRFFVDIFNNEEVIEIQTKQFNKLRAKLDYLLPKYKVTICYPIDHKKIIKWLDPNTFNVIEERKSPKVGNINEIFKELYRIKDYLENSNLCFKILLIDVIEYKLLDGWNSSKKRGATKYEKIPVNLVREIDIKSLDDYKIFLPNDLPPTFTSATYKSLTKISIRSARLALNILRHLGIIEVVGKEKNAYVYSRCEY